ncbi:FecR family protein, partial [Chitinophaga sp.]|uniref:FecR family protein n=1 Tax=Chitinophaga sp. TaxID=1869181 RepID=UPI002F92E378
TGFLWSRYEKAPEKKLATVEVTKPAPAVYEQLVNNTRKIIPFHLKDGSVVELAPGSRIKYLSSYAVTGREIFLTGEALFKVAPDKEKPFTVYAGNLGTTALGTVFKITAWETGKGHIRVQLISGKVVVKPDSLSGSNGVKNTYLLPGQDLSFDRVKMVATISQINKPADKKIIAAPEKEIFTFSNEPLANVFRLMSEKYKITIQCQESTLTDMSFTGTFDSSKESLTDFLSTIATLNNLTIKHTNHVIYITP